MTFPTHIILIMTLGIINLGLLYKLFKSSNKTVLPENKSDTYILRMNKLYYALGLMVIGLGLLLTIVGLVKKGFDSETIGFVSLVFLICLLLGLWTIVYFRQHRVEFDLDKIHVYRPLKRMKSVGWNDVIQIRLNHFTNSYILTLKDNNNTSMNQHLIGISKLLETAKTKEIKIKNIA